MKKGFDLKKHKEVGIELKQKSLLKLSTEIKNAYPQKTEVFKAADKANKALGLLRNALDNCVYKEFPDEHNLSKIYFGDN